MSEHIDHTPTPWTVCDLGPCDGLQIDDADGSCVIEDAGGLTDANAEFITRAVNCHGTLVEACRRLADASATVGNLDHAGVLVPNEAWAEMYAANNFARAALAKTTEKKP